MVYSTGTGIKDILENLIERGSLHNIYFVAELALAKAAEVRGYQLFDLFADYKTGIHFGGKVVDNPLLSFDYMQYKEQTIADRAGIGTLTNIDEKHNTQKIIVPLARR